MSIFIKHFFKKQNTEAQDDFSANTANTSSPLFLTTHGLNFYIENIIKNAKEFIYLVTPYFKLEKRLEELILSQKQKGIKIYVVCRVDDLKKEISIADTVFDRKNLHAKCFLNEKEALIGSLNLYDFSQINNDEMGFYISKTESEFTYKKIFEEITRFTTAQQITIHKKEPLHQDSCSFKFGKKYSFDFIDSIFNFNYKKPSGIKEALNGELVLFFSDNHKYENKEQDNIIYFQGQNTGDGEQKLIFGNKALFQAYTNQDKKIYLFKNYTYQGEYFICHKPYYEHGKWIFPLKRK